MISRFAPTLMISFRAVDRHQPRNIVTLTLFLNGPPSSPSSPSVSNIHPIRSFKTSQFPLPGGTTPSLPCPCLLFERCILGLWARCSIPALVWVCCDLFVSVLPLMYFLPDRDLWFVYYLLGVTSYRPWLESPSMARAIWAHLSNLLFATRAFDPVCFIDDTRFAGRMVNGIKSTPNNCRRSSSAGYRSNPAGRSLDVASIADVSILTQLDPLGVPTAYWFLTSSIL